MNTTEILVLGAGISGLLCATELRRAGYAVRVLDKGRGPGGRMSTRRMAGGRLDHGAQYFTVRDARFREYVDEWLEAGVIREWFRHLPEDSSPAGYPRYRGAAGMSDVAKHLAASLDVRPGQRAVSVTRGTDGWAVQTESGTVHGGDWLVATPPLPQTLTLLDSSGLDYAGERRAELAEVGYEKGLATLAILDGPSGLPAPGGFKPGDAPPLTWIADNRMKGISASVTAVTLHADAAFAAENWDVPDAERGPRMLEAAKPFLRSNVVEYACHRWGFTRPLNPWPEPCFRNEALRLVLAGDAFGGPRVEGAALSGLAAADALRETANPA